MPPDSIASRTHPAAPAGRWRLLTVLTTSYGLGAFGMLGASPLTPSLMLGLGLTRLEVAFIIPAIYLGGLLFSLPGGHLADRWGVRPTLLGGLALGGLGLALASVAPGFLLFLASLLLAGIGWSVVNPVLGKAIVDLFPVSERGIAMGVKQTGLTGGGVVAALVLPPVAAHMGWRAAVGVCALAMLIPVAAAWRPLSPLAEALPAVGTSEPVGGSLWWWLGRPPLLVLFSGGVMLGMVQSAVLSYLPVFTVQALGFTPIGAGILVAASQAGGAAARLGLGAASDRWLGGRRPPWLVITSTLGAAIFLVYAWLPSAAPLAAGLLAFAAGIGAYGWVGIYFIIAAEAGGREQSGLLSGVAFAAIVVGLLVGAPVFGSVLHAWDSYGLAWSAFALLSAVVALTAALAGPAIHRECQRAAHR